MPVYEYYCGHCDGIFEALRPMRESSDPVSCPECDRDGDRIMPTSFTAFTFREGYPRRLPDKGTYWHLEKEVKKRAKGPLRPFDHPDITPPRQRTRRAKGDITVAREKANLRTKELRKQQASGIRPDKNLLPKSLRK